MNIHWSVRNGTAGGMGVRTLFKRMREGGGCYLVVGQREAGRRPPLKKREHLILSPSALIEGRSGG